MAGFKKIPAFAATLPVFEDHGAQQTRYSTCYMCACRCGIKVTVENNKIRFIEGTPRHPVNKGVLCAKGSAGAMKQNSPAKLQQPMIRKSGAERGSGEFEPISWEQALDMLTTRLKRIRETDPKRLPPAVWCSSPPSASRAFLYSGLDPVFRLRSLLLLDVFALLIVEAASEVYKRIIGNRPEYGPA